MPAVHIVEVPPDRRNGPVADLTPGSGPAHLGGVPALLGGVRLISVLGEGGMGRVFLGHHQILDIGVAVKVLRDRGDEPGRFVNEARLAARIEHDNVVRILHAGDEQGYRFLVMEYVLGRTLKSRIQDHGKVPWREAAGYILQAARGLAAAHRQGIVHRDVKPSNLLLDGQGRVKVADLGLARALGGDMHMTATGSVLGTPAYMAPEQSRDPHAVTPAADVYALGACLFCLCAGDPPYPGHDLAEVMIAHRSAPIPDLGQRVSDVPPAVSALVSRMLAKDPTQRPADGAAVVAELERVLGLVTVSTAQAHAPARAQRRSLGMIGACALTLGGLSLIALPLWMAEGPLGAVAADPPVATPIAAAAPASTPWQTPPRAVFVMSEGVGSASLAEVYDACVVSRLPVVERARIAELMREQDLVQGARVDAATATRLGRLVGGHIALFVQHVADRVQIRTVVVETGELVHSRYVAPADVVAAVRSGLAAAVAMLPTQGVVRLENQALIVSVGARHGVQIGDRMELRHSPMAEPFVIATVTSLDAERSVLVVAAGPTGCDGSMARTLRK